MLFLVLFISLIFLAAFIAVFVGKRWNNLYLPGWSLLLFVSFILAGAYFLRTESQEISRELNRKSWPVINAEIIETKIVGERAYNPEIKCEYSVNGKKYILQTDLNTPGFGRKKSRQQTARIIIAEHPVGSQLKVFYNPDNPAEAFVRTGPYINNYLILSLGYILCCSGFVIIIGFLFRKLRSS